MPKDYITLDLPFGIQSNGTEYGNRGAWIDGSRVRWADNALRPIGGWEQFTTEVGKLDPIIADPSLEAARSFIAWKGNDGTRFYSAGSNLKLYAWGQGQNTVFDITPVGFTTRPKDTYNPTGYGNWFYGLDAYGTERAASAEDGEAFSWEFRTWGQNLLAAPRGAPSALYEWALSFATPAEIVPNAPTGFDAFHVTDQRIVMVAGQGDDPRMILWSDQEDNTDWTPQISNKAGFFRLPGIGRFKAIVTVQDQYILVSETDAYSCRYIGAPLIFGFEQIGENCGAASAGAVVSVGEFAMWPGVNAFYMCDGTSVQRVDCSVMDKFRVGINGRQATKTQGFVNPDWPEIWWIYQEGQGEDDDVDTYVYYNWQEQHWGYGKLARTAGGGYSALGGLVMISTDGFAYEHELMSVLPIDVDESEVFAKSGPIEVGSGGMAQYIESLQPDFISTGRVNVTILGRDRPGGPEIAFGPYMIDYPATTSQPVPTRARGHAISVLIEGVESLWTLGSMRLNILGGGDK